MLFLLTVVAGIGWATNEPAIANIIGWWRERPLTAWLLNTAFVIATIGFVWRPAVGQSPFRGESALEILLDKWQLGPPRMLNCFALMALVIHDAEPLKRIVNRRPLLEMLGSASLPVFCARRARADGAGAVR